MRVSQYFMPIARETPKEAEIVSHRLMLRSGMIKQQAAGIYSWLPLGLRVMHNIAAIVREEMDKAGAIEILMPTIQPAQVWRESGRYDDYGKEMLRITDRHDREMLYGPTNEEMVTDIFRASVHSYKQLPLNLYHMQWKFRDEIRPRFGVMRSREFFMKDAYSFDVDDDCSRRSYFRMFIAYLNVFKRLGLTAVPMRAETGPIGGSMSHEFLVLADTGETQVYCDQRLLTLSLPGQDEILSSDHETILNPWLSYYAATSDVYEEEEFKAQVPEQHRVSARGIEVGQTFSFATKYSQPMKARVSTDDGGETPVYMGSYGIGISRLVGALIEVNHDDDGIIWPQSVAPFVVGLINLKVNDPDVTAKVEQIYRDLQRHNISVLYYDTNDNPGVKFATMDLIGIPKQVIIGPRGLKNDTVEVKLRAGNIRHEMALSRLMEFLLAR